MTVEPTSPALPAAPPPANDDLVGVAGGAETCERVKGRLDDYLAGSMTDRERAGVDQHLALCPGCRTAAAEYFEVVRLAGSLPPVSPSPDAEARLLRVIERALGRAESGGG